MPEAPKTDTGWIQVRSGGKFYPLDPEPRDVRLGDIAHALAQQCRYSGHCREFFSVAQHCVLVSRQCPRWPLHGLLHDAAEAYLVDLPRPVKLKLRALGVHVFDRAEDRIMEAVSKRFALGWSEQVMAEVDAADKLLLATEARDLMSPLHPDWHISEIHGYPVLPEPVVPWTPETARAAFLARFKECGGVE